MSLQEHEKRLLRICFGLFVANNAYKSFLGAKSVACLVLIARFFPNTVNTTIPTFQEVGGVT